MFVKENLPLSMSSKPNFLVIVADDLGFTDLSCFGGEINTPNLDKLSRDGLRFTGFHTAAACSPTRSMLFSGTDNHIAGLGRMAEFAKFYPPEFDGKPGYEGVLNFRVAALPEILSPEYYTILSGKWHLGLDEPYWPDKRGFEQSFGLLPGAGFHFKHNLDSKLFMPWLYQENGKKLDPHKDIPDDFYSSEYYSSKFIEYLDDKEKRKGRPFFGALTYTAPHWPFQAHAETIAKYRGRYDDGPLELRKRRLKAAKEKGIIHEQVVPHPVETQREKSWEELEPEAQAKESRIMEVYAGMVEELDSNVGRVIDHLKETGEYENTVIFFLSDNGAEGMIMEALPFGGATFGSKVSEFNNEIDNIGKADSFAFYSDQWAQAATAPNYMYKMWAFEGGINTPLIIHAPQLIKNSEEGGVVHEFTTVMDILPTILDLAEIKHPGKSFNGRPVHEPKGRSWVPFLEKHSKEIYGEGVATGWELFGQRAIRDGNYKAVFVPPPYGDGKWKLFDLKNDPGEIEDIRQKKPEVFIKLLDHWAIYKAETGLIELNEVLTDDVFEFRTKQISI